MFEKFMGPFLSWIIAGTLVVSTGCPHGTGTRRINGDSREAGEVDENNGPGVELVIPDELNELISFAKQHAKSVDNERVLKTVLQAVEKGLEMDPKNVELLVVGVETACRLAILAGTHDVMADYGVKAESWATTGMSLHSTRVEFPYYRGMGMAMILQARTKGALEKLPEVVKLAEKAIALDEKHDFAGPLRFLGALYVQVPEVGSIGDKDKGIEILERAVAHFPDYPINVFYLGEAYYKDEQYGKAKLELRKVLDADEDAPWSPRDRDYYQNKAESYLRVIQRKEREGFGL